MCDEGEMLIVASYSCLKPRVATSWAGSKRVFHRYWATHAFACLGSGRERGEGFDDGDYGEFGGKRMPNVCVE